jgi:hypothetical protein
MARKTFAEVHPLLGEIVDGKYDDILAYIPQACAARVKTRFRKGAKVRLTGTKNVQLDGKVGTVIKVNTKTVVVGIGTPTTEYGITLYDGGEYNVPPTMLEAVA